jgi:hypothetical protein
MNKRGTYGQKWRGKVPHLQNDSRGKKIVVAAKDKADAYKKDIEQFGGINEVQIPVPAKAVSDYYNSKKCDYINVGTHGFFLLNSGDSLKLNAKMRKLNHATIPDFGRSATCKIRVRCQLKSSSTSDYQFVMTLQFSGVKKSPYNLAPLKTGSKSEIDEKALGKETLLEAF